MKNKFFIVFIIILANIFPLFSFEKEDLNGGWLVESNYDRLKNGDEYFTATLRIIKIGVTEYFYLPSGLLINLESETPEIQINFGNKFEILDIRKTSDDYFIAGIKNKKEKNLTGTLCIQFIDSNTIVFDIYDGDESFKNNMMFSAIGKKYVYHLIGKIK